MMDLFSSKVIDLSALPNGLTIDLSEMSLFEVSLFDISSMEETLISLC